MFRLRRLAPALLAALALAPARADEGRELFNGKDLSDWVAEGDREYRADGVVKPVWSVRDGVLTCAGKGYGFLRYDKDPFGDFALHLEYRMSPKSNSGVGIRARPFDPKRTGSTRPSHYSYEIQLVDDAGRPPSKHGSGALYHYACPRLNAAKPAGEWNALDVECVGPRIKVTINGQEVIDLDQSARDDLRDKPLKGFICLQNHHGQVEFRNLRVRDIRARAGE